MKNYNLAAASLLIIFLIPLISHAQDCNPSDYITGTSPPPGQQCNEDHGSECCEQGARYPIYKCSPPLTGNTQATLTLNGFQEGGDGGGASSCDGKFHDGSTERIVALSTGWFDGRSRCGKNIGITAADGNQVDAMVVDECDSSMGCDEEHSYQRPCGNNIVDASDAVWEALGLDKDVGKFDITWTDA